MLFVKGNVRLSQTQRSRLIEKIHIEMIGNRFCSWNLLSLIRFLVLVHKGVSTSTHCDVIVIHLATVL